MRTRIEYDKKDIVRRLRLTRHMPTREHNPKTVYDRKRENKNWRKDYGK